MKVAVVLGGTNEERNVSLATGRAMAIGHVIPLSSRHEMMNPVFADFIAGAGGHLGLALGQWSLGGDQDGGEVFSQLAGEGVAVPGEVGRADVDVEAAGDVHPGASGAHRAREDVG